MITSKQLIRGFNFFIFAGIFTPFLEAKKDDKAPLFVKKEADIGFNLWGVQRDEVFAGKNLVYLNNNNPEDVSVYFRMTNDLFLNGVYGRETYGKPVVEYQLGLRNRAIWGSPSTIALTLPAEIKIKDVSIGEHTHALPRLVFWGRENWLKFSLNELLGLGFTNQHTFTLGAFPFELGRGIALGAAYAAGPGPLGFFSDSAIDQYAFGLKLTGEILPGHLTYDLYGSILQSRSSSMQETNKRVFGQQIGRRTCPQRGFGNDNYLVAARLFWTPLKSECWGNLTFEPYVMYNNDPEQKIEFYPDASSKLSTCGLACEYLGSRFEFGFDTAFNIGSQFVRAWDRNQPELENRNGQLIVVNSKVTTQTANTTDPNYGLNAPFVPKSTGQTLIGLSGDTGDIAQNGQLISGAESLSSQGFVSGPLALQNANNRFRTEKDGGPYKNTYQGAMVVTDASYWFCEKQLQIAGTVGYASGDVDPNLQIIDGTYDGFIGLQEVYNGKRVKSVFLLGTVGKTKRPGTQPENPQSPRDFAQSASGFTNVRFVGTGATWKPKNSSRKWLINPNIFAYWEDVPGQAFDAITGKNLSYPASSYLGLEGNVFISCFLLPNVKLFAIGSIFCPGGHFTDIRGTPSNREQQAALTAYQNKGLPLEDAPNMGNNIGYTVNMGLEFAF